MIYFDNSATTPMAKEAIDVFCEYMKNSFGNPSSRHALGLESAKRLSAARKTVAKSMGVLPEEIYFTSGGTEGDNIALLGAANIKKGRRIVTTAIEHPAVLRTAEHLEKQGFEVVRVMPKADGNVLLSDILDAVTPDTCLVSVMHVNNETGAILPVDKIKTPLSRIAPRAHFHVDAVQSFGHIPFKPSLWGIDTAAVSSHKIHGPKGTGALFVRKGAVLKQSVFGGGQEKGLRSGTENVGAICAFAAACSLINTADVERAKEIKAFLKDGLLSLGCVLNGSETSSPYILNMSFPKIRSEIMLNALSNAGICVSSGSACAAGAHTSHVLEAQNAQYKDEAIRFSFSRYNTMEEAEKALEEIARIQKGLIR